LPAFEQGSIEGDAWGLMPNASPSSHDRAYRTDGRRASAYLLESWRDCCWPKWSALCHLLTWAVATRSVP